jgi:hypothetical protein
MKDGVYCPLTVGGGKFGNYDINNSNERSFSCSDVAAETTTTPFPVIVITEFPLTKTTTEAGPPSPLPSQTTQAGYKFSSDSHFMRKI